MPRLLSRYVLREILFPTLLALVALTFLFLANGKAPGSGGERLLLLLIRLAFQSDIPRDELFAVFLLALPATLMFLLPPALLIGIIVGVGRMTLDREVLSMQTAGINLIWVFLPTLLLGAALSGWSAYFSHHLEPQIFQQVRSRVTKLLASEISQLEPGRIYDELLGKDSGLSLYFEKWDRQSEAMMDVTLVMGRKAVESEEDKAQRKKNKERLEKELRRALRSGAISKEEHDRQLQEFNLALISSRRPPLTLAKQAQFIPDIESASVSLKLTEGSIHIFNRSESKTQAEGGAPASILPEDQQAHQGGPAAADVESDYVIISFDRLEQKKSLGGKDASKERRTKTTAQLWEEIGLEKTQDNRRNQYRAAIFERYSSSLECLVLVLLGLPLAIWVRPTGKSVGVILSFVLILIYHLLLHTGSAMMEDSEDFLGIFIVFSPNLLFATLGSALWWRMIRR